MRACRNAENLPSFARVRLKVSCAILSSFCKSIFVYRLDGVCILDFVYLEGTVVIVKIDCILNRTKCSVSVAF